MKLIFSFSTKIGDYGGGRYTKDDKTDHVLELYKVAMERANDFGHEVKFYGCDYCIDFLKGYYNESVSVENIEFDITDDLKMYIHSKEESGIVTIDGDLILNKKLKINENADVVFEKMKIYYQIKTHRGHKHQRYLNHWKNMMFIINLNTLSKVMIQCIMWVYCILKIMK